MPKPNPGEIWEYHLATSGIWTCDVESIQGLLVNGIWVDPEGRVRHDLREYGFHWVKRAYKRVGGERRRVWATVCTCAECERSLAVIDYLCQDCRAKLSRHPSQR